MQGQHSLITTCQDGEFVGNYWWTDHSCCELFKPISEEEFLRRCANKTNLKDIERALQLRARVTLHLDRDDVSPESPPNSNLKSITLPDCLRSVCCFLPHLKNCFVQRRCLHKFQTQIQVFRALNPYRSEYLEIKRIDRTTSQRRFFNIWHDLASF